MSSPVEIKVHDVTTFSNGTEYQLFIEKNCDRCRKFVPWEEATAEKPECKIEAGLSEAQWDPDRWPSGKIKMNQDVTNGGFFIPHCVDFEPTTEAEKAPWPPGPYSVPG